ncbi:MAG: hypothetical protein BAJALOKI2v1_90031 [Promethearchaeota archaeon]|nr:MAG: hypothetical protein BAJALOKI2v1_90031 [Candidatus Lokiarchaeota archaeon]
MIKFSIKYYNKTNLFKNSPSNKLEVYILMTKNGLSLIKTLTINCYISLLQRFYVRFDFYFI